MDKRFNITKVIECPFCKNEVIAKFKKKNKKNKTMAYFYGYCKNCKCSIIKAMRKHEVEKLKN